ncbi:MAG: RICIN domain-containing protein [Streptosporangiaceae bacterium]
MAGITPVMLLIAAAVAVIAGSVAGMTWLLRPAPAGPSMRLPVQPLGSGYRHPLAAITIPAASLQPELAQLLGRRIAAGGSITGYELRSAYPASSPLCLTAVTTGLAAGQNGDGVEASPCTSSARSEIWIPVQYEASGSRYTWLVNGQYQSMCLNADNIGGLRQGRRVQLWNCYLPSRDDFTRFNESWDFGTWLRAMKSGATSYPLFLGAGNYSLDADDKSLQGGLPAAPVSIIDHYTVPWEYWY